MIISEELEESIERAVNGLVDLLGLAKPSRESMLEAAEVVRGYKVETMVEKKTKLKSEVYFGLFSKQEKGAISAILDKEDFPINLRNFWMELKEHNRVTERPHVTLVHSKELPQLQHLWDRCSSLAREATQPEFSVKIGRVIWDERVIAVVVEDISVNVSDRSSDQTAQEFISTIPHDVRERLHMTIGTLNDAIKPVEAKKLVERWRGSGNDDINEFVFPYIYVEATIKGFTY
jgi:tRNA ligase